MRREEIRDDVGHVVIRPGAEIAASAAGHWDLVYTCGETPIQTGGSVKVTIPYGFTPPQISYRSATGYSTVGCSNPEVEVQLSLGDPRQPGKNQGMWGVYLFAHVVKGSLQPGDTITFHYGCGDRKGLTGEGSTAPYFESLQQFTFAADPDGSRDAPSDGFWLVRNPQPAIQVVGGRPAQISLVIPSVASPGDAVDARLTIRDRSHNSVRDFAGMLLVSDPQGTEYSCELRASHEGHGVIPGVQVAQDEVVRLSIRDPQGTIKGQSNPCLCRPPADGPQLYWGDIHVMTGISAGLGRPAEAYRYARDMSHLDFCATTDGDDDGHSQYYSDEEWEETRAAVRSFHEPGRFVTLLASECHERRVAGDKNIYYRDDDQPLIRWCDLEGEQPEAIWQALAGRRALTIPHHTASGSCGRAPWEHHNPEFQRLVEIYSCWGSSEGSDCPRPNYWHNDFNNSVREGLGKGYRMGIIACGDSHDGLPGNSSWMRLRRGYRSGLTAVWTSELSRESVFDALWNRSCYGTSGPRIILEFTLNDRPMGQELESELDRTNRRIEARAVGAAPISRIDVIRNGVEVFKHEGHGSDENVTWEDCTEFSDVAQLGYDGKQFIYYYVRVTQEDGELAWSSPIWVT